MANNDNNNPSNSIEGAIIIDAENLVELFQSIQDVEPNDSRLSEDRAYDHIEISHSLQVSDTDCASRARILDDKNQPVVFHDIARVSSASMGATSIAALCDYNRLFWFNGGFAEWEDKDYPFIFE